MNNKKQMIAVLMMASLAMAGCAQKENAQSVTTQAEDVSTVAVETETKTETEQMETEQMETEDWIELDENAGILTVRLPIVENSSYVWKPACSDETVAELITCSDAEGQFVASFRGLKSGECTISLSYCCEDLTAVVHSIGVKVEEDRITEVLSSDKRDMSGMYAFPDDTQLWKMRLANTVSNVFCYHDAMTCVTEMKTYRSGEEAGNYTFIEKFIRKDGYVCQEREITGDDGEVTNATNFYMAENIPGAEFGSVMMDDGFKSLTMFSADEYAIRMDVNWLYSYPGKDAELLGTEVDQEGGTTMMTVRTFDEFDEGIMRREFVYTLDEAGFITSVGETDYLDETDEIINVSHIRVTYDEPQEMHFMAVSDILESQDTCNLTVVINPGTENEEVQKIQVSKDTNVSFASYRKSELFSDEACTQPVDRIDVSQDALTVYVKLGEYY